MDTADKPDDPSVKDAEAVARASGADLTNGLTAQEAALRLLKVGPNELQAASPTPAWRRMLSQFADPLVYLLLVAIAIALVAWLVDDRKGWPIDALVIIIVVLLNGVLGYLEEAKARDAVAVLAHMTQASSAVVRGGQLVRVPSAELVPGDLLVLAEGDAIGADARLIQSASLRVHEASLTGESQAVLKDAATLVQPAALGDRLNMVFKGTSIAQGTGRAVVTATGMATQLGSIADLLTATTEEPTPLEKEIAHIGRFLGLAVIGISALMVLTLLLVSDIRKTSDVVAVLLFGVALAVAAVPEGLPAILSVVLALGVRRMATRNAIVKKLSSVEALGSATVIATDKTGTLTRSEMTIEQIITASGKTQVTGVGYSPVGEIQHNGAKLASGALLAEQTLLLLGGCLAGNASLGQAGNGQWQIQGDPTEAAFLVAERKLGIDNVAGMRMKRFQRVGEIPFTSERKMMSTIELDQAQNGQRVIFCKGAPDVLLQHCTLLQTGDGTVTLDDSKRVQILRDVDALSDAALRTLAVATRTLSGNDIPANRQDIENMQHPDGFEHDLVFVGIVGMMDPPREEAALAIRDAHRAGIRVIMITGDHPRTAARIASDLDITGKRNGAGTGTLTGLELDALAAQGDKAFADAVRKTSVYARVSPAHKLRIVAALQAGGNVVAMTGDGVNDAPALKSADIGIAMGITGTEVTKEAARVILADDNFATIVQAVREGRNIFDNIRKFLRYLLSSNMGEVLTVFLGVVGASVIGLAGSASAPATTVVLPLLATQILWLNLITDSWPALAMGIDPAADDAMTRKPRHINERVIDGRMWAGVFEMGLVIAIVALLTMDMYLPGGLIEPVGGTGEIANARTACFTVLVMAHLLQCFNARSETTSAFKNLFSNPWIWAAVALSGLLQVAVVNVGFLNVAFGTAPLTIDQWFTCAAMASVVLWYSELRKLVLRIWSRRRTVQFAHEFS